MLIYQVNSECCNQGLTVMKTPDVHLLHLASTLRLTLIICYSGLYLESLYLVSCDLSRHSSGLSCISFPFVCCRKPLP